MEIQVIKRGKEEERGGQKEINGAKHICRIRDYKSFRYFSILVKNLIFYESFQFGIGRFILIYNMKIFSEFVPILKLSI